MTSDQPGQKVNFKKRKNGTKDITNRLNRSQINKIIDKLIVRFLIFEGRSLQKTVLQ